MIVQAHLAIVEPLRMRAVQRWLARTGTFLVCTRQWEPRPPGRPRRQKAAEDSATLLRLLRTPTLFRGRALTESQLLDLHPELLSLYEGDVLVVPHLPFRDGVSLHVVGRPGLVPGSSATTALPLGISIAASHGLERRLSEEDDAIAPLMEALPAPTGPLTTSRALTRAARAALERLGRGTAVQESTGAV